MAHAARHAPARAPQPAVAPAGTVSGVVLDSTGGAPIARVAGLDTPFPFTLELEYLPSPERVTKAIAETARF